MTEAIALLRRTADECECRAKRMDSGGVVVRAEMMDAAAKWHWLAGEAAKLCKSSKESNDKDADGCGQCLERCFY